MWHPACPFCTGESCMFRQERNCFPLACCHVSFPHWLRPFESHVEMTFHYYLAQMELSALYMYSHPRVYFLAMNWTSWLEMNAYIEMVDEASIPILCTFDSRRQPFTWQVGTFNYIGSQQHMVQSSWCQEKKKEQKALSKMTT